MKINEVLNEVKVLIQNSNYRSRYFDLHIGMDYIFDGSCFLMPEMEDTICYDEHANLIIYFPNAYDNYCVSIPENDKSQMFNFMVQYNISTDNIETFKNVVQLYKSVC